MPDEKADINPITDPKLSLQARKLELEAESKKLAIEAETRKLHLEAGWLGRVVGSSKNAPNNTAFLILLLTFGAGLTVGLAFPSERVEFWKLLVPIITLTLGYMFGKSSNG